MPPITIAEIATLVVMLIGIGRVLQVQSQHGTRLDEVEEWQREHVKTPCTHRSKDWENESRTNMSEMKVSIGKIGDSIERLRADTIADRKWLNETFTEIRVDVATLKATRPEAK